MSSPPRRSQPRRLLAALLAATGLLAILPALTSGAAAQGPPGTADRVEQQALRLADELGEPESAPGADCPRDQLRVSWSEPNVDAFTVGGHIAPVGPAPSDGTESVSGIVLCGDATYAYLGFEAWQEDGSWSIAAVPALGPDEADSALEPMPRQTTSALSSASTASFSWSWYMPVEGYPAYDPQNTCSPTEKVGTQMLRSFLINRYAGSGSFGIVRECHIGGTSEHKEGRAFDWAVDATTSQRRLADDFIRRSMAANAQGDLHVLARRIGVMYMIWDHKIWGSYRTSEGWRDYGGPNPHTDHVHISLSRWAAEKARTEDEKSFYDAYDRYGAAAIWPSTDPVLSRMLDVSHLNLFLPEISYMIASGLSTGYSDGTYRPLAPVKRNAMAAFLWRMAGSPPGPFPDAGFSDVSSSTPFRTAINWMAYEGYTDGYDDGTFRPTTAVSRGAMVEYMYRIAGSPTTAYPNPGYSDVSTSHTFYNAIRWASATGIVDGYDDGTFKSTRAITRQAMAAFMHRWIEG